MLRRKTNYATQIRYNTAYFNQILPCIANIVNCSQSVSYCYLTMFFATYLQYIFFLSPFSYYPEAHHKPPKIREIFLKRNANRIDKKPF